MPLPKPNTGESREAFIERCMSDETMKQEYPNAQQRIAVCAVQWTHTNYSRK